MADKLLKSIKFPTLPDRYVIGDTSLSEEGAAADAKAVGDALATKADTKGMYEDLIVGGAEQLMSDEYETDSDPYLFRPTGGSADVGNREYVDKIVGGTVAWNQLVPTASRDCINAGTESYSSIMFFFRLNASPYTQFYSTTRSTTGLFAFVKKATATGKAEMIHNGIRTQMKFANNIDVVENHYYLGMINFTSLDASTVGGVVAKDIQLIDLTQMFGSTIADYIYSLEQSQAGAGVAWFRNYFPKDYYPYDKGALRSVEGVSAHETVGFNQWDEEWENGYYSNTGEFAAYQTCIANKNHIRVTPGATYYFMSNTARYSAGMRIVFRDSDGATLSSTTINGNVQFDVPENCYYIDFSTFAVTGVTTYKNDICINLSDPSRNGEYEPYQKHTYPLDSSLTLRGVPKLVDGKLAFDGDVYPPSGEVQRRYGLRAYQSGDESLADAITDGTNTVYKLATPTTETAEGYEQYQVCDPSGTEEFVTTGIVPVGHETRYPHDLKKKIETAPNSPSADGTYLMKRSGGKNTYMALPSTPSANGSYVLTVTVSGGTASYSWTAKE